MCPSDTDTATEPDDLAGLLDDVASTTRANAANAADPGSASGGHFLVPGIDAFLGRGYDVFGEYASPNSVKGRIYDLPAEPRVDQPTVDQSIALNPDQLSHAFSVPPSELRLVYSRPERVGYTDVFQSSVDVAEITTSDKEKIKWGIGSKIEGGYGGFSGEIKGRFDTEATRLATTRCLQAVFQTIYWKLDLNNYSFEKSPPIAEDVRKDFAIRPIDLLMEKYGTHCLVEVGIGTKIVHSYTIDTSKFSKSMDVTAALKAKYDGGSFNAGMDVDSEYHDAAWKDRSAVSVKIFTYGTSDSQLAEITDLSRGLSEHPLAVLRQGWHNPTLIQFYKSSLRPLWTVDGLMSAERAAAFEERFRERARTEQVQLDLLFEGLQPVYLLSRSDDAGKRYRLERTPHYGRGAEAWTVENDGRPWQFTSAGPRDGMVPLYEFVLNDDSEIVRYETEAWSDYFKRTGIEGYTWSKSGRTLGYVYEGGPDVPVRPDAIPVYAFYDKDGRADRGLFYSQLKELVWDKGQWKGREEGSIEIAERRRAAQAALDRWWDSQDGAYRFFHQKPDLAEMSYGYVPGDPDATLRFTPGIAHWHALRRG